MNGGDTNQHPPLPADAGRGRSSGILLGVPRELMFSESAPSGSLDVSEVVRSAGDVLLDGVSGEGDWLSLEEFEFLDMVLGRVSVVASGGIEGRACY